MALARDGLGLDDLTGHLFLFLNRRRDRLKVLVWDRSGFWVLCKRLERADARVARGGAGPRPSRCAGAIWPLLSRVDVSATRRRPWYEIVA
jgi:transposase